MASRCARCASGRSGGRAAPAVATPTTRSTSATAILIDAIMARCVAHAVRALDDRRHAAYAPRHQSRALLATSPSERRMLHPLYGILERSPLASRLPEAGIDDRPVLVRRLGGLVVLSTLVDVTPRPSPWAVGRHHDVLMGAVTPGPLFPLRFGVGVPLGEMETWLAARAGLLRARGHPARRIAERARESGDAGSRAVASRARRRCPALARDRRSRRHRRVRPQLARPRFRKRRQRRRRAVVSRPARGRLAVPVPDRSRDVE